MAYSSAELLGAMLSTERLKVPALRVDGGAAANDWLMQFQADILDIPVERPHMVETTALGAAGLAGLAVGAWPTAAAFGQGRRFTRFEPKMSASQRESHLAGWRRAVSATLAWARAR
jgi:glycerol kinase